jgi:hypothetical protein
MKNLYKFTVAMIVGLSVGVSSYGQMRVATGEKSIPGANGFGKLITVISSPNFHHEHDGEHCLTDHMTEDWIQSEGIAERYHQEEQEQAIMARDFDSGNRATYVVPIIFHVVHNPSNPAENVSQSAIYNLLDAVNEDFSATNSDITDARTALGFIPANADIEFCLAQRDPSGNQLTELVFIGFRPPKIL